MKARGLALFFVLLWALLGCYADHGIDDAAVRDDASACTADGAYDVPFRIDGGSPAGCLEPGGGTLPLHIPPISADFGGGACDMASVTEVSDCVWRVDVTCNNPDASSHVVGTVDARGGIHGSLEVEFSGFTGEACRSTMHVGE